MPNQSYDEEGMGPLERGRGRYQQKDYAGALVAFKEAVEISAGNLLLTALDHRAAAYEKLDKLQAALRDSKQMIDLRPELAKGYMRCAKVLQLKGEINLAMKIYERGLIKVKIGTDNERTRLQSLYNKLRQAQDVGKSLDPLEFLPLELAQMVIENLGMRDRVVCLAVTKTWKRLLSSSYRLWTTLDTRYTRKPVSLSSLKAHLKRSNYTLDTAIISTKAKFDGMKMQYLTRTCNKLKNLEICGSGVVGYSLTSALPLAKALETLSVGANCEIKLSSVLLALKSCQKTLVEANFSRVEGKKFAFVPEEWPELQSLKTLNLRSPGGFILGEIELRDKILNIRSLTLRDWVFSRPAVPLDLLALQDMESLEISNTSLQRIPLLPANLRDLTLRKMPALGAHENGDEVYELSKLEKFDCYGTGISANLVKAITLQSIKAGSLKVLHMGGRLVEFAPGVPVEDEFPPSNSLEELSLSSLIIRERRILDVIKLYPNLRRLDVSNTKVTGVAVKQFVSIGIKWLKLDECTDVSPDAVDYARGKDVDVEFNFPSRSGRVTSFRDTSYTGVF